MAKTLCVIWGVVLCMATIAGAEQQKARPFCRVVPTIKQRSPAELERALAEYDKLQQAITQLQAQSDELQQKGYDENKASIVALEQQRIELNGRLDTARNDIDQLGSQRGCAVSRLYWYTDLAEAQAESVRQGRPILSLRMLGKLTDEYSCANSRFFRTTLYSNKELSDWLRTNFVLHWQSVRPVPRVTIDFGDGRKLERTITGNSAHYVLASDGTPLDVLPGLYSPLAFRQHLWDACDFYGRYAAAPAADRAAMLQAFHQAKADEAMKQWDFDIQRLGAERSELVSTRITSAIEFARLSGQSVPVARPAPKAAVAARQAVGKSFAEAPMIRFAKLGGTWMERGMDDDVWQAVANLHREDVKLDEASVAVVRKEFPAAVAMRAAVSKSRQEDPVLRMVRAFEDSIALDTVRNEYLLHRRAHEKFAAMDTAASNVDTLNEWVYAELFLTPSSDPWLGLAPNDVYTALDQDGRTEAARN